MIQVSQRRQKKNSVDINIAPLLDMVFILLIFFLVTANFNRPSAIEIERPQSSQAQNLKTSPTEISIDSLGRLYLDGRGTNLSKLPGELKVILAQNPGATFLISADRRSKSGLLLKVHDLLGEAGIQNIAITAERKLR